MIHFGSSLQCGGRRLPLEKLYVSGLLNNRARLTALFNWISQ
jgi:hypothetical protein